jgi:hypothetical protein
LIEGIFAKIVLRMALVRPPTASEDVVRRINLET